MVWPRFGNTCRKRIVAPFASVGREVPVISCCEAGSTGSEVADTVMPRSLERRVGRLSLGISEGRELGGDNQGFANHALKIRTNLLGSLGRFSSRTLLVRLSR